MKILCIAENRNLRHAVEHILGKEYNLSFADNPLGITETLREQEPDIIMMNSEDFPFHWRPLLIMADLILEGGFRFILLTGKTFLIEDSTQAEFLGAELVPWNTEVKIFRNELLRVTGRKTPARKEPRETGRIDFAFSMPDSDEIIPAERVYQLSDRDIVFSVGENRPLSPDFAGKETKFSILRLDNMLIRPECRIESVGKSIRMVFTGISAQDAEKINSRFASI